MHNHDQPSASAAPRDLAGTHTPPEHAIATPERPTASPHNQSAAEAPTTAEATTPAPTTTDSAPTKRPVSERRKQAARENGAKSHGPTTAAGKSRSCLNATRHGILSQVIHFPAEELAAYDKFTAAYVAGWQPVGPVETELANACADLQFRLHRTAAAEHNLFAAGHEENGDHWQTGHPESHTALTLAETMRRSKDPLLTLSTYEQRLNRRFLQTVRQLREIQAERRTREQQELEEMYLMANANPEKLATLEPADLGFVCSTPSWTLYKRRRHLAIPSRPSRHATKPPRLHQYAA